MPSLLCTQPATASRQSLASFSLYLSLGGIHSPGFIGLRPAALPGRHHRRQGRWRASHIAPRSHVIGAMTWPPFLFFFAPFFSFCEPRGHFSDAAADARLRRTGKARAAPWLAPPRCRHTHHTHGRCTCTRHRRRRRLQCLRHARHHTRCTRIPTLAERPHAGHPARSSLPAARPGTESTTRRSEERTQVRTSGGIA